MFNYYIIGYLYSNVMLSYQIINQSNNSAFNFNQSHRIKDNFNGKDLAINLIKNSIK